MTLSPLLSTLGFLCSEFSSTIWSSSAVFLLHIHCTCENLTHSRCRVHAQTVGLTQWQRREWSLQSTSGAVSISRSTSWITLAVLILSQRVHLIHLEKDAMTTRKCLIIFFCHKSRHLQAAFCKTATRWCTRIVYTPAIPSAEINWV